MAFLKSAILWFLCVTRLFKLFSVKNCFIGPYLKIAQRPIDWTGLKDIPSNCFKVRIGPDMSLPQNHQVLRGAASCGMPVLLVASGDPWGSAGTKEYFIQFKNWLMATLHKVEVPKNVERIQLLDPSGDGFIAWYESFYEEVSSIDVDSLPPINRGVSFSKADFPAYQWSPDESFNMHCMRVNFKNDSDTFIMFPIERVGFFSLFSVIKRFYKVKRFVDNDVWFTMLGDCTSFDARVYLFVLRRVFGKSLRSFIVKKA